MSIRQDMDIAEQTRLYCKASSQIREKLQATNYAYQLTANIFLGFSLWDIALWIFVPYFGSKRERAHEKVGRVCAYLYNRRLEILETGE